MGMSHGSGGWTSKVRVLAGVVCSETLFLAGMQLSYCGLTWWRERSSLQAFFLEEH